MKTKRTTPARLLTASTALVTALLSFSTTGGAQVRDSGGREALQASAHDDEVVVLHLDHVPPPAWAPRDTADALYRRARALMADGRHRNAAEIFGRIAEQYPDSEYAPDALYWQAFNLYRLEDDVDALRSALEALRRQASRHPRASTRSNGEAATLATRIRGRLAARGDEASARQVRDAAEAGSCDEQDVEMRSTALSALVELGPAEALPILRDLVRSDEGCNPELRGRVPYLLGQLESEEAVSLLLELASSRDESLMEVRKSAVRYLGEARDPRALEALSRLVRSGPEELQGTALYALTRHEDPRASEVIWDVIRDTSAPADFRKRAIGYLGRDAGVEELPALRQLFESEPELRGRILYAVSQIDEEAAMAWLLEVARDRSLDVDTRKSAVYQAGRRDDGLEAFVELGADLESPVLRKSFVYGLSERDDPAAVDALIRIVRTETDPDVRKSAIYWLGRTEDPRAAEVLKEIIGGRGDR